jgi:hypothetical protein
MVPYLSVDGFDELPDSILQDSFAEVPPLAPIELETASSPVAHGVFEGFK